MTNSRGFTVIIHPLVILNISDHFIRVKAQTGHSQLVIGALFGKQDGRTIELLTSFELLYTITEDKYEVDMALYKSKEEQFKQVFSGLEFLGWYSSGESTEKIDLMIHQQMWQIVDCPIFFKLNNSVRIMELPIAVFESVIDLVNGETKMSFSELPYTLATDEAERIGVDHVKRVTTTSGLSATSTLSDQLLTQHSAIKMLHSRIKLLHDYVKAVQLEELPVNHEILRNIKSLCNRLPITQANRFNAAFVDDYSEVALLAYLSVIMKGCNEINQFGNKFNILHDKQSSRRAKGMLM